MSFYSYRYFLRRTRLRVELVGVIFFDKDGHFRNKQVVRCAHLCVILHLLRVSIVNLNLLQELLQGVIRRMHDFVKN